MRINIEHMIGVLRARYASLRSLPVRINNIKGAGEAYSWVGPVWYSTTFFCMIGKGRLLKRKSHRCLKQNE